MNNMYSRFIVGLPMIALFFGILFYKKQVVQKKYPYSVGIMTTASHPALNAVSQGCKEIIKAKQNDVINIIEKNGQGSSNALHLIAQSFARDESINLVVAIATPAAQSSNEVIKNKTILYAAVSDPLQAGLINDQIKGVADSINLEEQVKLIQTIAPKAKTIGLIYNKGEINAISMIKNMTPLFEDAGLKLLHCAVTTEAEVPQAIAAATTKSDIIFTPIDNTVASTIDLIAQKAYEQKIPLIVSDNLLVSHGALAASGVDYYASGKLIGERIIDLLINKKSLNELDFSLPQDQSIHINKKTAEHLGIDLAKLQHVYQDRLEIES